MAVENQNVRNDGINPESFQSEGREKFTHVGKHNIATHVHLLQPLQLGRQRVIEISSETFFAG